MTPRRIEAPEEAVRRIALEIPGIETTETRNLDSSDFHDIAIWALVEALEKAYGAGGASALSEALARQFEGEGR